MNFKLNRCLAFELVCVLPRSVDDVAIDYLNVLLEALASGRGFGPGLALLLTILSKSRLVLDYEGS